MATQKPVPAYAKQSAFVTLYYKGNVEERDDEGKVVRAAQPAGPMEMYPVDASQALATDPDNWSREPWDGDGASEEAGDDAQQSAHGDTDEEIYANDEMHAMRTDGFAAEPAGSPAGRRPGAYSPARSPRRQPAGIVDPAKDKTTGAANDPVAGDVDTAASRNESGTITKVK